MLVLFAAAFSVSSCIKQAYDGGPHGSESTAVLLVEIDSATESKVIINGKNFDNQRRITLLPGSANAEVFYKIKGEASSAGTSKTGSCRLNFSTVAAQQYQLKLGFLDKGNTSTPSQARLTIRRLNTSPSLIYGTFDKEAQVDCKDTGGDL